MNSFDKTFVVWVVEMARADASIGPSLTFGYVAAKHAAGLCNQLN